MPANVVNSEQLCLNPTQYYHLFKLTMHGGQAWLRFERERGDLASLVHAEMKTEAVLTAAAAAVAAAADSEAATTAQVPACVSVHTKVVCVAQSKTTARCHCILQLMHLAISRPYLGPLRLQTFFGSTLQMQCL